MKKRTIKSFVGFVLILALCAGLAVPVLASFNQTLTGFSITAPNLHTASSWSHLGITNAIILDLVPPALQNNYRNNITRAEFAALAVALYEHVYRSGREITGRAHFNDTTDVNVQKMGYLGVVQGVGDGNFAPHNPITREQAAVMLVNLAAAMGYNMPAQAPLYADLADISPWAVQSVGALQAGYPRGIMGGVGEGRFSPRGSFTREQSIITMVRLFDRLRDARIIIIP